MYVHNLAYQIANLIRDRARYLSRFCSLRFHLVAQNVAMTTGQIMTAQEAAEYLGLSIAKVRQLWAHHELGWMFLDDLPAKRKPMYTTRQFCDMYIARRSQTAMGVLR